MEIIVNGKKMTLDEALAYANRLKGGKGVMKTGAGFRDRMEAQVIRGMPLRSGVRLGGEFKFECFRPDGSLRWSETAHNLVVNDGLQHILDILFVSATTQIDPWYIGLIDGAASAASTPAATDTMASHSLWTEEDDYSQATRVVFTEARTAQSVDNVGNEATFSIDTDSQVIEGGFLTSDNTKMGSSGTLLCVVLLASEKSADNGDSVVATYTFTSADDGA